MLLFALTAAASAGLSWAVRRLALKRNAVVPPRADRWHRQPTASFGGVAIALSTLVAAGLIIGTADSVADIVAALAVSLVALAIFVVGLADDWLQLSPLAKLVATLTIGAFFVFGVTAPGAATLPPVLAILAMIWFGGVVHALNLLDNMDGLAAGIGLVAALLLPWVFGADLGPALVSVLIALAGSLAGFLVWNRYPARLFMGDCGSLFIGAVLAASSLVPLLAAKDTFVFVGVVAGLVLVVPLFDTSFVLVLRRLAGRSATRGGTDHISHRLVSLGLSERTAVRLLYVLGLLGGLTALGVRRGGTAWLPLAGLFGVGVMLLGIYLARVRAYNAEDFLALQKSSFAPFLKDLAFRWHAGQVLLDIVLIWSIYYASYLIRFEGDPDRDVFLASFTSSLPVVLGCKLVALYVSGLYARSWATFGLRDLYTVVRGVGVGTVLSVLAVAYFYRFEAFSRGVFLIDGALLFLTIVATRISFRAMGEAAMSRSKRSQRVLIYGAGSGGQLLVREMHANPGWNMNPVAFIDDDPMKQKRWILGVPVRGGLEALELTLERYRADELLLSSQSITGTREQQSRDVCARLSVPVRRLHLEIR